MLEAAKSNVQTFGEVGFLLKDMLWLLNPGHNALCTILSSAIEGYFLC